MTKMESMDFDEIVTLKKEVEELVSESGQITLQIELFESDITELKKQLYEKAKLFRDLLTKEQVLLKRLTEKYGAGSIDFETGEFTPEK